MPRTLHKLNVPPVTQVNRANGAAVGSSRCRRYTHGAVLLILVALGLAIYGTIRVTRSLEPGQRVVAWVVFVLAVIWLFLKLVQLGLLGRATGSEP